MKYFSLLFIAFHLLQFTLIAQSGWVQQTSGTTENLNSVFFVNENVGWAVGEDSTILHTLNGGLDWIPQPSGFSGYENYYNDVFFTNDTLGWVVGGLGYGGVILHTSDGGNNWIKQSEATRRLNTVYFINDTVGWIGGGLEYPGGKIILKTTNRGLVWDTLLIETQPTNSIFDIKFINENIGWAVGGVYPGWGNIIMKTTDGGDIWITQLENYFSEPIASCSFISEQIGWVTFAGIIFNPVGIMNTTDGGIEWGMQYIADSLSMESINSIIFIDNHTGWAAGCRYLNSPESRILHTSNGGLNWQTQNVITEATLNSIFFINEYEGWAVGDSGLILHTTTGGVVSVEGEISGISDKYNLTQNFPNPFNPTTKIKYSVPQTSNIIIKVCDILGNEIETLVNEEKQTGTYEITWYAEGLPSGIYFYRIQAGSFVETKKMVLMK